MSVIYKLNEEVGSGERVTYGIEVFEETELGNKMAIVISDISFNREAVQTVVELCNRLELSPVHIYDVVDDYLTGKLT